MRYLLLIILCTSVIATNAQQIGIPKPANEILVEATDTIRHYEIENWVGKKILFLPIINSKQMYDYVSFLGGTGFNGRPKYSDCVDQTATVLSVRVDSLMPDEYLVKVKMNNKSNSIYYGRTYNHSLTRVVLQDDIDLAEKLLKGKIFWMKLDYVYKFSEKYEHNNIKYGFRFKKIKINRVEISFDDNALFMLTLSDEMGENGVLYVNVSNNNIDKTMINNNLPSKYFYTKDPHKIFNWNNEVWQTIEAKEIYKGMTEEQAKLSWGIADYKTKLKDGSIKYKYNNGSYFIIKEGKVTEMKQ